MKKYLFIAIIFTLTFISVSVVSSHKTYAKISESETTVNLQITVMNNRVSMYITGADIRDVLNLLAEKAKIDITTGGGISGKVWINLSDVSVEEAIKKLCRNRALIYEYLPEKNFLYKIEKSS